MSVAKRVAEECGVQLGQGVGYSIRFEVPTSVFLASMMFTFNREIFLLSFLTFFGNVVISSANSKLLELLTFRLLVIFCHRFLVRFFFVSSLNVLLLYP